jgi:nitrogen fixation NifU-like protein
MGKYSETLSEHVMAPRNGGAIDNPDLTGRSGAPGRGAFMIIYLRVQDERIAMAKYHTVGCGPTIASGSMLTEMIVGRPISEGRDLKFEDLIKALDGMPPDKMHCPALAIGALKDAISKWPAESKVHAMLSRRARIHSPGCPYLQPPERGES